MGRIGQVLVNKDNATIVLSYLHQELDDMGFWYEIRLDVEKGDCFAIIVVIGV